jgi:hypothetical protein
VRGKWRGELLGKTGKNLKDVNEILYSSLSLSPFEKC